MSKNQQNAKQAQQKSQSQPEKQNAKNEVAVREENQLVDNSSLAFKGNEAAEATDILIPRILLMQGTSKWVPETFNMGQLITTVDEELLADKGETITIIPFLMKKTWEVFTAEQPPKWLKSDPWTAANDNLDWEYTEEDPERGTVECKRQRNYGFYCFVLKDGKIGEFDIPSLINFRSSSGFRDGKKIASHFGVMKSMNQPGFTLTWDIGSESIKDGDKQYQKFIVKKGRNVTAEEQAPIIKWLELFKSQADSIVDHDVDELVDEPTGPVSTNVNLKNGEVNSQQQAQF